MTEVLLILVVALIIFGPRKLPQLGRTLGETLAQFRRASEDFKRTWEAEVKVEEKRLGASATPGTPSLQGETHLGPVTGPGSEASATDVAPEG
jgi:TatA/E family protein of Tat protein translocase